MKFGINQVGSLDVVVPADIIDEETSNDVIVAEGQSTILVSTDFNEKFLLKNVFFTIFNIEMQSYGSSTGNSY